MKCVILGLVISINAFASEVVVDRNSYGALTVSRDVSLLEEDGGAILIDSDGLFCQLTRKDNDNKDDKFLIKNGTTIIFGDYQVTGDHSSGVGVSWKVLNIQQVGELNCWLDNSREGLELLDIIAEISAQP